MVLKKLLSLLFICASFMGFSQDYTSYFTGDPADVITNHQYGVCLMGGATENDEAIRWFLEKADGGDVVVLRASGSDGYNNYFFSELGVTINSVETLKINNAAGATDPYVLQQVANAEAIWFAGGDQFDYVSYFKDTEMEDLLNDHINVKHAVIGGTSAGMAILGGYYFSAQNGTVTSAEALSNPYGNRVQLGYNDFLEIPFLENVVTDTHYDDPDRRGRHFTFLARYTQDTGNLALGIACEEYTSVCMDENGIAHVYGEFPSSQDYAYFLQADCTPNNFPENCTAGNPLTWNHNTNAVRVYKVPGTLSGENTFDVSTFSEGTGGVWEKWYANNGTFSSESSVNPNCSLILETPSVEKKSIDVFPNPFGNVLNINNAEGSHMQLFDVMGREILYISKFSEDFISTEGLQNGFYFLKISSKNSSETFKLLKE